MPDSSPPPVPSPATTPGFCPKCGHAAHPNGPCDEELSPHAGRTYCDCTPSAPPVPALGELDAADAKLIAEFRRCCEEWGASLSDNWHARVEDTEAALSQRVAQLVAAARKYLEACEALARKHNNPDCACVFCEDLRAARASRPTEVTDVR